jgi:VCBS repeat-containing protein
VAVVDNATTDEDNAVVIDVLANDTDVDGDALTVTGTSDPANGSVAINADGTITYTPDADFVGTDTFTYDIADGNGGTSQATVTVDVNPVNDPPVAVVDTATTNEDNAVVIDVLANDTDVDGDTLTVTGVSAADNGSVVINANGTITYTPDANFAGTDTFTYDIADGNGGTSQATVTVEVNSINDTPVAVNDSDEVFLPTESSTSGDVLTNDSDPDDGPAPLGVETPGSFEGQYGTLDLEESGDYVYTVDGDKVEAGLLGPADQLVAYWKFDQASGSTVTDDAPTGSATNVNLNGNTLTEGLIGNAAQFTGDSRATMPNSSEINVGGIFEERTISLHFNPDSVSGRQVLFEEGGGVRGLNIYLQDDELFIGGWNRNESGWDGSWISLGTVNVGEWNHVALVLNGGPIEADGALSGYLNGEFIDDASGSQLWSHSGNISLGGSGGASRYDGGGQSGAANNFSGKIDDVRIYNKALDQATVQTLAEQDGTLTETFDYQVTDGEDVSNTAQLEITLDSSLPPNEPPVAVADDVTTAEDTALVIDVMANDSDANGDALTVTDTTVPSNGSVVVNADGTLTYTPDPDFSGTDSFEYTVEDPSGESSTTTVTIAVDPTNDTPVAVVDSATTAEDSAVVIDVLANDSDADGDALSIVGTSNPANGSVTINGDGTLSYTPDPDFVGTDTFEYTVEDASGASSTATVTVDVDPTNDAPVAVIDNTSTDEDTAVVIDVLANDTDMDGDVLSVTSTTDPANGSVTINGDGTLTYTPDPDFEGTDSFEYTMEDPDGATSTATVTVEVNPANDPPVAVVDTATTAEDTALVIDVLANDTDPDGDALTVTGVGDPANGSAVVNGDGTITYTPDPDFEGTDSFAYTVQDPSGATSMATVTVTVDPANDAPVAVVDTATTIEDAGVIIDVLANDSDVDGDALTVTGTTAPANGTAVVNANGTITYTPDAGFEGTDTFTYTVQDPTGESSTATVTVAVNPGNDTPVAVVDSVTTTEDSAVVIDVLANDTDADGDTLTVSGASDPANGSVVVNGDGTITYTPDSDFEGTDTFSYTVEDPSGATSTATVTVTVDPANDVPVAVVDTATTIEDAGVIIDVLANDSDIDGDALTVTGTTAPANGTAVVNTNGTITYTPDPDFEGTDSFDYTIEDPSGETSTATVTVEVNPANDPPVAVVDTATTDEDTGVVIDVLANDSDAEGDTLSITGTSNPANGSVAINGDGTLTYTPDPDFVGTDTFEYTVEDASGASSTATVTVDVDPTNDAPVAVIDNTSTDEDTAVVIDVLANDTDVDGDALSVTSTTDPANGSVTINLAMER